MAPALFRLPFGFGLKVALLIPFEVIRIGMLYLTSCKRLPRLFWKRMPAVKRVDER